jgi:hypothetical protein
MNSTYSYCAADQQPQAQRLGFCTVYQLHRVIDPRTVSLWISSCTGTVLDSESTDRPVSESGKEGVLHSRDMLELPEQMLRKCPGTYPRSAGTYFKKHTVVCLCYCTILNYEVVSNCIVSG